MGEDGNVRFIAIFKRLHLAGERRGHRGCGVPAERATFVSCQPQSRATDQGPGALVGPTLFHLLTNAHLPTKPQFILRTFPNLATIYSQVRNAPDAKEGMFWKCGWGAYFVRILSESALKDTGHSSSRNYGAHSKSEK